MWQSQSLLLLILSLILIAGCGNSGGATLEGSYAGGRSTSGLFGGSSLSLEKYTFYSDGTVELRIGKPDGPPSLTGKYRSSGTNRWIINWDSGQTPAQVERVGDKLNIDGTVVSPT
jgi:hypothetical protein